MGVKNLLNNFKSKIKWFIFAIVGIVVIFLTISNTGDADGDGWDDESYEAGALS